MATKTTIHNDSFPNSTTQASGTGAPTTQVFPNKKTWTDSVTGSSVPWYQRKLKLALQATSSLNGSKITVSSTPGSIVYKYSVGPAASNYRHRERSGHLCENIGWATAPSSPDATTADNVAREKFYSRYRSSQTSFQGGVALGELRETLRMLRNPAKELRNRVGSLYSTILRNKRRAGRTNSSKNRYLSQTWLEGSFGWMPLINDIKGAYETLEKRGGYLNRNIVVIVGRHSTTTSSVIPSAVSYGSGGLNYSAAARQELTCDVKYRGAIVCKAEHPFTSEARLWGFSPDNIVPTVWELVPYSFLIDYFTNVGKVIDAWSMVHCSLAWGARTERRLGIRQVVDARSSNSKPQYAIHQETFNIGNWRSENKTVIRTPINTVPIPDFRFKLPGFSTQWVNIAALVRTRNHRF